MSLKKNFPKISDWSVFVGFFQRDLKFVSFVFLKDLNLFVFGCRWGGVAHFNLES